MKSSSATHPVRVRVEGRTVAVRPAATTDTLADLVRALGHAPVDAVRIDGRRLSTGFPLSASGLVDGSDICLDVPPAADDAMTRLVVKVVGGPDAGRTVDLPVGTHLIGRSPGAAVRVRDPRLQPHHAVLRVTDDGGWQLCCFGREGAPVRRGRAVVLGASLLEIGPPPTTCIRPLTDDRPAGWQRTHHRPIRTVPHWVPAPIAVPAGTVASDAAPSGVSVVVPALAGLAATAGMALALHQPLLVLFGISAAAVGMVTWAVQRVAHIRRRRRAHASTVANAERFRHAIDVQQHGYEEFLRSSDTELADLAASAVTSGAQLWGRRPGDADVWRVVLGRGQVAWAPVTDADGSARSADHLWSAGATTRAIDDVPVAITLAAGEAIGIAGPGDAAGLVRSLVCQLALTVGPADWALHVVSTHPQPWRWTAWLPHAEDMDLASNAGGRQLLVVVDDPSLCADPNGAVRRVAAGGHACVVVCAAAERDVPSWCTTLVSIGADCSGRWRTVDGGAPPVPFHAACARIDTAEAIAAALAGVRDPEAAAGASALPDHVHLLDLIGDDARSPEGVAHAWERAGRHAAAILGVTAGRPVVVDLDRDGPHLLVGGTTGSGKSELLRTLVASLAVGSPPDDTTFVLVDYKGGAAFDACARLPHVVGLVTDLDAAHARRALRSLEAEVAHRERLLRAAGAADLASYRRAERTPGLARLVVVVDEFATLAADLPGFVGALVSIAQRGRSLGLHLVLATQRPGAAISDDIRANTNARIALRVQDRTESADIVGCPDAAGLSRRFPGRAVLRVGGDPPLLFQAASTAGSVIAGAPRLSVDDGTAGGGGPVSGGARHDGLAELVATIAAAHVLRGGCPPRRPWLPPLPATFDSGALPATTVGMVDDPDAQDQRPLRWSPDGGHLVVVGARGAGASTALLRIAAGIGAVHLYAIDGSPDRALASLATHPACGAVVPVDEAERLGRLLRRLEARIRHPAVPAVVVLVDGLGALRAYLDAPGCVEEAERWQAIVRDGPSAGVTLAVAADSPQVVPFSLLARAEQRWVGRLADPADAAMLGVAAGDVPGANAPPGRFLVPPGHLAQLALAPGDPPHATTVGRPPPVNVLPARVAARAPAVGISYTDLGPVLLPATAGTPFVVAGHPGSGRTTALLALARSAAAGGHGVIVVSGSTAQPWAADSAGPPPWTVVNSLPAVTDLDHGTVVVDDADHFDADDGALATLCGHRRVMAMIGCRVDALRHGQAAWPAVARRGRSGLLLGRAVADADLLGAIIPRHLPRAAPPGRAALILRGEFVDLVQMTVS